MKATKIKGSKIQEIIDKLDNNKKEIVNILRSLIKKTIPNVAETVKWRNLAYLLKNKNLAWILIYKDHIDLGFFMGSKLKSELLEGTGKNLRHIKIRTKKDIVEKEFINLIKEASILVKE